MESIEDVKNHLEKIAKPFQQEQMTRQKKSEFLKKTILSVEKNDFFQLDELLKSKQSEDLLNDSYFEECSSAFSWLKAYANQQIDTYRLQFNEMLSSFAADAGLSIVIEFPRFKVIEGIEGSFDFQKRSTTVNQTVIKSVDPKRIVSVLSKMKRELYDAPFDAQRFVDILFERYTEIVSKSNVRDVVPVTQLYAEYVWSLQLPSFFCSMEKKKFKGYSVDQFAIDLWRYMKSPASPSKSAYRISLKPGRGKGLWLIDENGERRLITQASFVKVR